jgi:GMP synthase-like glutamine amidotransferase
VTAALILQHGEWGPPAVLAEWAAARGIPADVHRTDLNGDRPALDGQPFVASLGSNRSPAEADAPAVREELAYIAGAVERDIPVLGLCYGGQILAAVLGGRVERAPEPELGWHAVQSAAPDLVPAGPWLQWHYDRFTVPPGAEELARSPRAVQAFRYGPHLGVQFHPESTIEIVQGWARLDQERLAQHGIEDGEALVETGRRFAAAARAAAFTLFDAFWERARTRRTQERRAS